MTLDDRRPSRVWVAVAATALVLLAFILVTVILLSARLRRPEQVTVIQPVPAETGAATAPPSGTGMANAPRAVHTPGASATAGWRGTDPTGTHRPASTAAEQPVKVVERPVKVVEKQVKVVEKETHVIEKPPRGAAPPASTAGADTQGSDRTVDRDTFQQTGLPNQIAYAGKTWNASDRIKGLPADLLADDPHRIDGHTVYHDHNAAAPYAHVYLKLPGQTDQYVRYVPTAP
jgi:hypothetical protein